MIGWIFGPLEDFRKFDKHYDEPESHIHREDCPMGYKVRCSKTWFSAHTTLCLCKELNKADREAEKEDRADDDRKYGGM